MASAIGLVSDLLLHAFLQLYVDILHFFSLLLILIFNLLFVCTWQENDTNKMGNGVSAHVDVSITDTKSGEVFSNVCCIIKDSEIVLKTFKNHVAFLQ